MSTALDTPTLTQSDINTNTTTNTNTNTTNYKVDSFVLTTGSGDATLKATMNRYRPAAQCHTDSDGLTTSTRGTEDRGAGYILLFGHGVGFHKEHWTPIIERLFTLFAADSHNIDTNNANANDTNDDINNDNTQAPPRILEAWAVDYQSHGEAAAMNREVFERRPDLLPTVREYGEAFAALYKSGKLGTLKKGVQRVVLIGHSAGAIGCVYATTFFTSPSPSQTSPSQTSSSQTSPSPPTPSPFDMLIMLDPAWFGPTGTTSSSTYKLAAKTTPVRRYRWESRGAAYAWMKMRFPWKFWDERVLRVYTEHGLRPTSSAGGTGGGGGVELVCSPMHEAAAFSAIPDNTFLNNHMRKVCGRVIPFHLAFGSRSDLFSREIQESLYDPSVGHIFESVTRIDGGGHLIVQERPDRVADYLYSVLKKGTRMTKARAPDARL